MRIFTTHSPVILVIWSGLGLSALVAAGLGRWSLAFVSFATLALALVPPLLASRWSLTLPLPFLLATTGFVIFSIFLGEAFDFYEKVWWWDLFLHGASAISFGLFGFLFVFMLFEGDRFAAPPSAIAFITFCVAVTVGAVWEIFEFMMDTTFGLNMQKSGLPDTMGDLIIDACGAALASGAGYLYLHGGSGGFFGSLVRQFIAVNRRLYQKSKDKLKK